MGYVIVPRITLAAIAFLSYIVGYLVAVISLRRNYQEVIENLEKVTKELEKMRGEP